MKEIQMRLYALREEMKRQKIHAWMAPTNDFHGSEYIGEYFKARRYLTGFTGSVGTAVITMEGAWLWVDGRYFVQAEKQLAGSGIILCKSGEPGVPDVENFLADSLSCGQTLGLDGRVISTSEGRKLKELLGKKGILVSTGMDLVDKIWKDRPPMSKSAAWFLSREEAGESRFDKLKRVRLAMEEKGAGMHLITALDDIAWLYNMRGNDIACSPVIQAYSLIAEDRTLLFVQEGALKEEQIADLLEEGIEVRKYEDILEQISALPACTLLLDPEKVSFELYRRLPEHVAVKEAQNPSVWMKAVKNPVEMEHIRTAHQKDGTAMTRFVYWVKHTAGKELVTERKAAACLEAFRKEQEGYLGPIPVED